MYVRVIETEGEIERGTKAKKRKGREKRERERDQNMVFNLLRYHHRDK